MNKVIFVFIIIIVLYLCNKVNNEHFLGNTSFKRCNRILMNPLTERIFKNNNIIQNNSNWSIYLPCGYNNINNELKTLHGEKDKLIFGIDGCDNIISKNNMWNIIVNYYGMEIANRLCPKTYTNTNADILRLKREFNPKNKYILKKNIQSQKGLYISDNLNIIVNNLKNKKYVLVQEMLKNPFLINKRKINIRIYILVICQQNCKKIYYHNDGLIHYTPGNYNSKSITSDSNITSGYIFINNNEPITLQKLYTWLSKNNYDYNVFYNNLNSLLRKVFIALKDQICNDKYLKDNKTFQLFGADIAPDNKMNFKIIEINKGPNMKYGVDNYDKEVKDKVMNDVFDKVGIINSNTRNGFVKLW